MALKALASLKSDSPKFTFIHNQRNRFLGTEFIHALSASLDDKGAEIDPMQQGQDLPIIFVVEDDRLVQGLVEDSLSEGGFAVAIVGSGEEAVELLKAEAASSYRALVTDIHLSGEIDGWEVARTAREINATLPVVYMTGAAGDEWASKGVPNSLLLNKPFAPAQLVTAVSQLLNAAGPTS